MLTTKEALDIFFEELGGHYPYNQVKKTRNKIYCKWLMLTRFHQDNNEWQNSRNTVVSASSFDYETLQHMIISRSALPLTPDMDKVMDWMFQWGRTVSPWWYNNVVWVLYFKLINGFEISKYELFMQCMTWKITRKLEQRHFQPGSEAYHHIYTGWTLVFPHYYNQEDPDFHKLYIKSVQFIMGDAYMVQLHGVPTADETDSDMDDDSVVVPTVTSSNVVSP